MAPSKPPQSIRLRSSSNLIKYRACFIFGIKANCWPLLSPPKVLLRLSSDDLSRLSSGKDYFIDSSLHATLWTCSYFAWRKHSGFKPSPYPAATSPSPANLLFGRAPGLLHHGRSQKQLKMPLVDVAMARSLRPAAWELIRDAVARSVAESLTKRDILTDAQDKITDAKTAFSSWDNCMKAAFCKYDSPIPCPLPHSFSTVASSPSPANKSLGGLLSASSLLVASLSCLLSGALFDAAVAVCHAAAVASSV